MSSSDNSRFRYMSRGTTEASGVWVFVVPREVCGQVAFSGSHLVDSARNKLVPGHKRVLGESRRVGVVGGGREVSRPSV